MSIRGVVAFVLLVGCGSPPPPAHADVDAIAAPCRMTIDLTGMT